MLGRFSEVAVEGRRSPNRTMASAMSTEPSQPHDHFGRRRQRGQPRAREGTLEDEGYRVVLASSGAEGIAAFAGERPDCVLLDVRMPEVDGFAACERIRALPGGPRRR